MLASGEAQGAPGKHLLKDVDHLVKEIHAGVGPGVFKNAAHGALVTVAKSQGRESLAV